MRNAVLSHGDGFLVTVDSTFVLNRPRFHMDHFTPYAAIPSRPMYQRREPPAPGGINREYRWVDIDLVDYEDGEAELPLDVFHANFRQGIRYDLSLAERFVIKQRLCRLLDVLTDGGYEVMAPLNGEEAGPWAGMFISGRLKGKGAPALARWRLSDLHYATGSDPRTYFDLPTYVAHTFSIARLPAWRIAWVLVRYALLDNESGLGSAIDVVKQGGGGTSERGASRVPSDLDQRIATLRRSFL